MLISTKRLLETTLYINSLKSDVIHKEQYEHAKYFKIKAVFHGITKIYGVLSEISRYLKSFISP